MAASPSPPDLTRRKGLHRRVAAAQLPSHRTPRTQPMTEPHDHARWLQQVIEPVLEPGLPIVDPHHHLWDLPGNRYLAAELLTDLGAGAPPGGRHDVRATVFVECMAGYRSDGPEALRPIGETEFVAALAGVADAMAPGGPRIAAGIVGFADLTLGTAVEPVLQAHLAAGRGRLRGIRHAAAWHADERIRRSHSRPPPGLLLDARFRAGFAQLAPLGLSFDAWLYHPQIGELADLARAFPDTTIVLDHYGGPLGIGPYEGRADAVYAGWCQSIDELAGCPNVVAKLGGLHMPINGFGWHKRERPPTSLELADATRRYVHHAIERFGPGRCMFESNFPVDKASCSYTVLWNAFKRLASGCSAAEKALLFHDTAARVYRLHPASA
jgi:predicted TIM-barrel fold metal-dependent hydrolase